MTKSNFRLYYTSCLVSSLFILFYSCKDKHNSKNNPSNPPTPTNCDTCHSILEAKDYFAFKEGSYWVFEEETTHERDSMYVTQSWISPGYDFYVKIKSQLTDFEYSYWPSYYAQAGTCSTINNVSSKCLYVNRSKGKPNLLMGDLLVFFVNYFKYDHYTTNELYSNNSCLENTITFSNIFQDYDNGNFSFGKTLKINESCSYHYGQQPVNLYYSKGVGIVRKELIDSNQVWNLVKYKIAL